MNKGKWNRRLQIFNRLLVVIVMVMFSASVYLHDKETMAVITMSLIVWYLSDKMYKSV